jgi:putative two-component system response regulator
MWRVKTVLVVDGHLETCRMLACFLQRLGVAADCVTDGLGALRYLRERGADLLLLDDRLPGMNGWALVSKLRQDERTAALPVVMMTAFKNEPLAAAAAALGIADVVAKAAVADPEALRSYVARYVQ